MGFGPPPLAAGLVPEWPSATISNSGAGLSGASTLIFGAGVGLSGVPAWAGGGNSGAGGCWALADDGGAMACGCWDLAATTTAPVAAPTATMARMATIGMANLRNLKVSPIIALWQNDGMRG